MLNFIKIHETLESSLGNLRIKKNVIISNIYNNI